MNNKNSFFLIFAVTLLFFITVMYFVNQIAIYEIKYTEYRQKYEEQKARNQELREKWESTRARNYTLENEMRNLEASYKVNFNVAGISTKSAKIKSLVQ